MAFQVSPGVVVSETDLTAGAQSVSVSDAGFAGPFAWGPALDPQNIGSEDDLVRAFGKPDDDTAPYWFAAKSFLDYSDKLHAVRALAGGALNSTTSPKALAGAVVANGANWHGSSNTFDTTNLVVGQEVVVNNALYTITAVTDAHNIAVTPTPDANVNTATSIASYGLLIKNVDDYTQNFSGGLSGYGAWVGKWAGDLGNTLKVSVASCANAFSSTPTGNVTLTAGSNTVVGDGNTSFTTEVQVGDFITVGSAKLQVATVANVDHLTVFTAPTKNAVGSFSRTWQYASLFDRKPGTSAYAGTRGGSDDEMHIVVIDAKGVFSGTPGVVLERFPFASKAADAKNANGDNNYYVNVVNRQSQYIWWLDAPGSATSQWGSNAASVAFGTDPLPNNSSLRGGQTDNENIDDGDLETAYDTFKDTDSIDVSLLITGPASASLGSYIVGIAESRADCVTFLSPGKDDVVNNVGQEVASIVAKRDQLPSSSYAFMDSGWKYMNDKYNDVFRWVPLNGDIAGLAARTDTSADPWFSPAGLNRGNIKNVAKLAWNPKQLDRDELYKVGVNPVVQQAGGGTVLFGDKTMLDRPSAFDRINVRRLFIVLEKTISRVAKAQLFEFNDEFTRSQFRNIVEPFLRDVKARRGVTDYRVVCDDTNNTTQVIDANEFVGDIYVKPARSINFIQLNFIAVSDAVSFQEVTGAQ
jgi:hypothetical protein